MKFTLSSSQQKELLIRGRALLVALPMQRDCDSNEAAAQLAAECLVLPDGARVVRASIEEIEVSPSIRSATPERLIDVLGWIVREDDRLANTWMITRHVVIMALVMPRGDTRGSTVAPQWPGGRIKIPAGADTNLIAST